MRPKQPLTSALLVVLASGTIARGQAPLFADGAPFGGSQIFSEGFSPRANSVRFDRPTPGLYLSWTDGDHMAKDAKKALDALRDAARQSEGVALLDKNPWAIRSRAYAISWVEQGVHTSLSREETTGFLAKPDLDPTHLGGDIALNTTTLDVRRTTVDRLALGAGSQERGAGYGVQLRIERWKIGRGISALNPIQDQSSLELDPLSYQLTQQSTTAVTLDFGYTFDLAPGFRMGTMVDRAIPRRFGDVRERPQFRAGLQVEFGPGTHLAVEYDINKTMRMPLPIEQRTGSASLRLAAGPQMTFLLGAERRTLGDSTVTRGGLSLFLHGQHLSVGLGFQVSQDRPLKGLQVGFY